ncbi:MAG: hypothetical protein Q9192_008810, partial [Flavoplaca navasiana]
KAKEDACTRMLELKEKCVRKGTGERYIIDIKGGRNNSIEPDVKMKYTHGFIVEFASEEDRRFYVEEDGAHRAFVEGLEGVVGGVGVLDFEAGGGL